MAGVVNAWEKALIKKKDFEILPDAIYSGSNILCATV